MSSTETMIRSVLSEYGAEAATGEIMGIFRATNRKKLSASEVRTLRMMHRSGSTQAALAERFSINPATVSRIVRGIYF